MKTPGTLTEFSRTAENESVLERAMNDLVEQGANRDDFQVWQFDELYYADPETLPPDVRRLQLRAWSSPDMEELRQKFGLPKKT